MSDYQSGYEAGYEAAMRQVAEANALRHADRMAVDPFYAARWEAQQDDFPAYGGAWLNDDGEPMFG